MKMPFVDAMWFPYTMLGIYFLIPILRTLYNSSGYLVLYLVLLYVLVYYIKVEKIGLIIPMYQQGFLFYVLIGGLFYKFNQKEWKDIVSIMFILAFVVYVLFGNLKYFGVWILLFSSLFFYYFLLLGNLISNQRVINILKTIADCSFGIFLVHFLVFDFVLYKIFYAQDLINNLKYFYIPFAISMIFVVCLFLVFIIKKIPYIRNIVQYNENFI